MVGVISGSSWHIGGLLAIIGVIVPHWGIPRSAPAPAAGGANIDQGTASKRIGLSIAIFIPAIVILVFAKTNANGFNILWRHLPAIRPRSSPWA